MQSRQKLPATVNGKRIYGYFSHEQGLLYAELASRIQNGNFVEIGVHQGLSMSYILKACRENGSQIYAVDIWRMSKDFAHNVIPGPGFEIASHAWERGVDIDSEGRIRDISGVFKSNIKEMGFEDIVKCMQMPSVEASKEFSNGFFDLVFIDAGHSFEQVQADIKAWLPKVKKGGIIAGHDYSVDWPGVIQAVNEKFGSRSVIVRHGMWFVRLGQDYAI
jgi:predicted O-methyltransferase YrrM